MNSHTGAKPFQCAVCNKSFSRRASLWNHCRIHIEHWPFQCPLCDSRFKWKNCLYIHWRMHIRKDPSVATKLDSMVNSVTGVSFIRSGIAKAVVETANNVKTKINQLQKEDRVRSRVIARYLKQLVKNGSLEGARGPDITNLAGPATAMMMTSGDASGKSEPSHLVDHLHFPVNKRAQMQKMIDSRGVPVQEEPSDRVDQGPDDFPDFELTAQGPRREARVVNQREIEAVQKLHFKHKSMFLFRSPMPRTNNDASCPLLPMECKVYNASEHIPDAEIYEEEKAEPIFYNDNILPEKLCGKRRKTRKARFPTKKMAVADHNFEEVADETLMLPCAGDGKWDNSADTSLSTVHEEAEENCHKQQQQHCGASNPTSCATDTDPDAHLCCQHAIEPVFEDISGSDFSIELGVERAINSHANNNYDKNEGKILNGEIADFLNSIRKGQEGSLENGNDLPQEKW